MLFDNHYQQYLGRLAHRRFGQKVFNVFNPVACTNNGRLCHNMLFDKKGQSVIAYLPHNN